MADYEEFDEHGTGRSRTVETLLNVSGWVMVLLSFLWGVASIVDVIRSTEETTAPEVLAIFLWGIAGGCAGLILFSFARIQRRLDALQQVSEQTMYSQRDISSGRQRTASISSALSNSAELDELVLLMREVRDITLLNDEQRSLRLAAQGKAVLSLLQREVPVLLREHNWIEARNRVQEARERFPTFTEWDEMERQIEVMRAQVEARDIAAAERQIEDLTALGAWDRVAEVIKELLERHPEAPRALEMAQGLRAQRHKAETEQRTKLMAQAQEATSSRAWKEALAAATILIQRYPKSPEAQALRIQLPTLQENAEIQIRQGIEAEIRGLIKAHRFDEALRKANELIQQYPASPQAAVLREQLPRLEEKAAATGARY